MCPYPYDDVISYKLSVYLCLDVYVSKVVKPPLTIYSTYYTVYTVYELHRSVQLV